MTFSNTAKVLNQKAVESENAHHDDAYADPDTADDVQFAVEHLVNSRRTALMSQGENGWRAS